MPIPDILFKGVPRRYTRGYTAEVIAATEPTRVIIPCVGAYALATTAVTAGVPPSKIEACDISLYSSVIGASLTGQAFRLEPLGRWKALFEPWLQPAEDDPCWKVAMVVVGIRLCQYETKKDTLYTRERMREVTERIGDYMSQAYAVAKKVQGRMRGLQYTAEDMWDLLGRHHEPNEKTLILCNPPRYEGGYKKMYEGVDAAFSWDEPNVSQFGEDDYERLVRYLDDAPRTLLYYATPVQSGEDPADTFGYPWRSVFAARPRQGATAAINWIVSNQPDPLEAKLQRADVDPHIKGKYKLFTEGTITDASDLRVVVETREVSSYYRDLFVHNLGHLNAERYKVLLLDGKLLATVGLHLQNLRAGGSMQGIAKLRFAFTVTHPDYPRLHKLTLLSICSSWFFEEELKDIEPLPRGIQTTMLTPYPEAKTARGIFTLQGREFDEKLRMNKLTYYGDVIERTPQDTIRFWLQRWGQREVAPTVSGRQTTDSTARSVPAAPA